MIRLQPGRGDYDERHYLHLRGTGELGDGETLKICLGESVVCGRSRHCGWSLKRAPTWLGVDHARREALRGSMPWRATSRRHCRLSYVERDVVEVENLSPNGTYVDDHRVDRILLTDCRRRAHTIRLGPVGVVLRLEPGSLPLDEEAGDVHGATRPEARGAQPGA